MKFLVAVSFVGMFACTYCTAADFSGTWEGIEADGRFMGVKTIAVTANGIEMKNTSNANGFVAGDIHNISMLDDTTMVLSETYYIEGMKVTGSNTLKWVNDNLINGTQVIPVMGHTHQHSYTLRKKEQLKD